MTEDYSTTKSNNKKLTRRKFLLTALSGSIALAAGSFTYFNFLRTKEDLAETFIASVSSYSLNLKEYLLRGFKELKVTSNEIKGKTVLLKPNLVEPHKGLDHINTHPLIIRAVIEAFLHLGASRVLVAEGAGHRRDSLLVMEESGLGDVLYEDSIPFIDLNNSPFQEVSDKGGMSRLKTLFIPKECLKADYIVSLAKMKTHHWASVTLSMKNLFGIMPGSIYGWPKNVLHWAGIDRSIFDINATVKPHLAIVDGVVGMEGDGPIMGTPVNSKVIIIGRNLPAVDATSARVMGINPIKISYLKGSSGVLGTIRESNIIQRGESISSVSTEFRLINNIPAHKNIRL